jgi:hypothetical protein
MESLRRHVLLSVSILIAFTGFMPAISPCSEADSILGPSVGTYRVLSEDGQIRIPFVIFRDDILMIAEVNGRQVRMMLDNGVLWDQLLFFGGPRIDALALDYDSQIQIGGPGEGEPIMSDMASDVTIRFPGIEFAGQPAITTPYSSGITNLWEGSDGQISAAFFKNFVVDIDFDRSVITLIEPDEFSYAGRGQEIPMEPASFGSWTIPGTLETADGKLIPVKFMLDLGASNALTLTTGPTYSIEVPAGALKTSLGFGVQGEIKGHTGRVRSVRIGRYKIDNVLAGFTAPGNDERTDDDAYIGFCLLSRFNVIFDYPGRRMFVEPNSRYSDAFEYGMSGMVLRKGPGETHAIVTIHPNSPAAEAGLAVGDLITRVNGRPAGEFKSWELQPLFQQKGSTVDLGVSRDGKEWEVSLILRRLI